MQKQLRPAKQHRAWTKRDADHFQWVGYMPDKDTGGVSLVQHPWHGGGRQERA